MFAAAFSALCIAASPVSGFVTVPAGEYQVGNADHVDNHLRTIRLKAYEIARADVTNEEFQRFVNATGYKTDAERYHNAMVFAPPLKEFRWIHDPTADWKFPNGTSRGGLTGKMDHPVTSISFYDAEQYCKWAGVRLPTLDEWEVACRAGTGTDYFFGTSPDLIGKYANVWHGRDHLKPDYSDGYMYTSPVGKFLPNPLGLYDMYGNVFQFCSGRLPSDKSVRAVHARGGSWWCSRNSCCFFNSVDIGTVDIHASFSNQGFRIACGVGQEELPTATPAEVGLSADKLSAANALIQAAVDKNRAAGVVLLVLRHGKVVETEAVGKQDRESGRPMRADSIFRIYSMTKPITSVAALMLVEKGMLNLDDPVSKYLPAFKGLRVYAGQQGKTEEAKRQMTVRDLMRHTSGLTYGTPNGTPVDQLYIDNKVGDSGALAEMVTQLGKLPLLYQPGTTFHYSVSTDVLGRIIEVVSGQPLDEFFQDQIFTPIDMRDTAFFVPANNLDRFAASYHSDNKGGLTVSDDSATRRFREAPKLLSGGGGLVSTARDYARFCQMLLNGGELQGHRLLKPETVREMTMNQLPPEALPMSLLGFVMPAMGFGLGVSVRMKTPTPEDPSLGEFGWSGAASTFFWVSPKADMAVVVLQQVVPLDIRLEFLLRPAIYAAIEK